jgi:hypothetical protein
MLLALWGAVQWWHRRPVHAGAGVLAPAVPVQVDLPAPAILQRGAFTLRTRAHFDVTARVLAREDYDHDALAPLVPVDLALGWGRMSDSAVLATIDIAQADRFYYWHTPAFAIPRDEIARSSANMHMIPADPAIDRALHRVRPGQVVHIDGFLVDVDRSDGVYWRTSMTRDDEGAGACEIIYVESLR